MDGTLIAAIITGILALLGALATAWTSGWNEHRTQARANKKALARHSVPLIIAAWDLANWFYDITDESNYSPERCAAYGDGWNSQFTSYLLGQYFAGVHIVREMTHFFAHIRGEEAETLKRLLWKIQDEFTSMYYDGRESHEMRWFEGDILAVQEHLTETVSHGGDGAAHELRTIGFVEFQKRYAPASTAGDKNARKLSELFEWYEDDFQRIVYRRFKALYATRWDARANPQAFDTLNDSLHDEKKMEKLEKEEARIKREQQDYPGINVIIPDHRIRRLQHLLTDLVEVLDAFTTMKLNRPIRRCTMLVDNAFARSSNPQGLVAEGRVPCDCNHRGCNAHQADFEHRRLPAREGRSLVMWRESSEPARGSEKTAAALERKSVVERSKV